MQRTSKIGLVGSFVAGLMLFVAAGASATPPSVTTNGASSVAPTSVLLNGSVNPNGHATTWYFQIGTSTGYGTNTVARNAGSGTKPTSASIPVTGLSPGATYDFRIVASSGSGTSFGANQTFVTPAPPAVETQAAESVTASSATLLGAVNPGGLSTTWTFEYGITTSYGSRTPVENIGSGTTPMSVSAPIASLAPGTAYHYRLDATSAAGTSYGPDISFTTAPALTLRAHGTDVVQGRYVVLSGIVTSGAPGVGVTILGERYGTASFIQVGATVTRNGGVWTFYARPRIATTYQATANGGSSQTATIAVRPAVTLTALAGARIKTHVTAGIQLIGRLVQLQRLANGRWVTVAYRHLTPASNAIFHAASLPRGRSRIRIAMSVNEAGPGLLAGFSRTIAYRRR
jgi:hypothetical protein